MYVDGIVEEGWRRRSKEFIWCWILAKRPMCVNGMRMIEVEVFEKTQGDVKACVNAL